MVDTGHNIKWHHLEILERGKTNKHCLIKDNLLIKEYGPSLNGTIASEKLIAFSSFCRCSHLFSAFDCKI